MRAVLVFNPHATTTDDQTRNAIVSRLRHVCELDVQPTKARGHATLIVAGAVDEGVDAVFALGGDGTVNEVVQTMAGTPVILGAIPGGGTNVFARALGFPNDAIAATDQLVEAVTVQRTAAISLGMANDRYFCFHAGFGFDAAVVRGVEQEPGMKRWLRQAAFVAVTIRTAAAAPPSVFDGIEVVTADGTRTGPGTIAIVGNTTPWTFLQSWPLHVTPQASLAGDLDVTLMGDVSPARLARLLMRALRNRLQPASDVAMLHDLDAFRLVAPTPRPLQLDGDYNGEHTHLDFRSVRAALRVYTTTT